MGSEVPRMHGESHGICAPSELSVSAELSILNTGRSALIHPLEMRLASSQIPRSQGRRSVGDPLILASNTLSSVIIILVVHLDRAETRRAPQRPVAGEKYRHEKEFGGP